MHISENKRVRKQEVYANPACERIAVKPKAYSFLGSGPKGHYPVGSKGVLSLFVYVSVKIKVNNFNISK